MKASMFTSDFKRAKAPEYTMLREHRKLPAVGSAGRALDDISFS